VSWYEAHPQRSLDLIRAAGISISAAIIDVGAGASSLVDALLAAGYRDVTVLDISAEALQKVRQRLGANPALTLLQQDVTTFQPLRAYGLWHDRAVFHFLVLPEDRARYVDVLRRAVAPGGHVIISTFGPSGPDRCSGLPVARYDAPALAAVLGREFSLADSALSVHRTPWGSEQQFLHCRFDRQ
jgi:SAM-dependent methyltransferase